MAYSWNKKMTKLFWIKSLTNCPLPQHKRQFCIVRIRSHFHPCFADNFSQFFMVRKTEKTTWYSTRSNKNIKLTKNIKKEQTTIL